MFNIIQYSKLVVSKLVVYVVHILQVSHIVILNQAKECKIIFRHTF